MLELKPITGVYVNYYFICKRKMWLFANDIRMEQTSETVAMGKFIDESTYTRKRRNILIDNTINIDFFEFPGYICEVKKSDAMEEADKWQVKFYIYYLKKKGLATKGILHYPKQKRKELVELTHEDETKLEKLLVEIEEILTQKTPPPAEKKKSICRKCSYFELCFV